MAHIIGHKKTHGKVCAFIESHSGECKTQFRALFDVAKFIGFVFFAQLLLLSGWHALSGFFK